ncbi:MAG TPA: type II toxin-antitoxin system prevent-host-death family antitoxin [Candidatus Paceibacterota bacterium]
MTAKRFPKVLKSVGVSDFRAELSHHLARAKRQPLVISERRGNETYVVLSADDYNVLVEAREDAIDARELTRLVEKNQKAKFTSWKSVRSH